MSALQLYSDSSHVGSLSQEAGINKQQTFISDAGTSAAPEIVISSSSDQRLVQL